ncbi:MAG TPA: PIG-L deacetylase family protein [Chloroflexota bacterium]|nr:PIG-L deacetylase family protein [Chloroflexota bacterium]
MRVLAVTAHPDDVEILCAGTLARYAQAGNDVTICNATSGDRGSFTLSMKDIGRVRDEEARLSAGVIGARYICLGFHDCGLVASDLEARTRFIDLFREVRPDVVLTHHPDDYHADHQAVSRLVQDASFMAGVPLLETAAPNFDHSVPVIYMDTLAGLNFTPEEFVDITAVIGLKREMLAKHQSQVRWTMEHDGIDLVEFMETMGRFRGIQCGARFAEAFVPKRVWLRTARERLLP